MRYEKWDALGNTYVVVEPTQGEHLREETVAALCDPARGPGGDGVLEVTAHEPGAVHVTIWNPDGSTAEMSGNGTRIAAAWSMARSGATAVDVVVGPRRVSARRRGTLVEQDLGPVRVEPPEDLEVDGELVVLRRVDVGNPHAVLIRSHVTRDDLHRLGPRLETDSRFPERTNVQLVRVDGPHGLSVLVWERGVGETSSSGTSAVAAAAAASDAGLVESPVRVQMPGGALEVGLEGGSATLLGPASLLMQDVFSATI